MTNRHYVIVGRELPTDAPEGPLPEGVRFDYTEDGPHGNRHPSTFETWITEVEQVIDDDGRPCDPGDVILFTSNHPYFVDLFEAGHVLVVTKSGQVRRLSEHPDWKYCADALSTGEFWTSLESW